MNKLLTFSTKETNTSKLVFGGKILKLIYSVDVPSTASIWWKNFRGFDNVKLFPENKLSLQQELNFIKKLVDDPNTEPLLIVTKSPFILMEFPNTLVNFAKLDESSVTHFISVAQKTLACDIESIISMVSDVRHHPQFKRSLESIEKHIAKRSITDEDIDLLKMIGNNSIRNQVNDEFKMFKIPHKIKC